MHLFISVILVYEEREHSVEQVGFVVDSRSELRVSTCVMHKLFIR